MFQNTWKGTVWPRFLNIKHFSELYLPLTTKSCISTADNIFILEDNLCLSVELNSLFYWISLKYIHCCCGWIWSDGRASQHLDARSIYNEKLYKYTQRSYVHSEYSDVKNSLKCFIRMLCKVSLEIWVKQLKNLDFIKMQKKSHINLNLLLVRLLLVVGKDG